MLLRRTLRFVLLIAPPLLLLLVFIAPYYSARWSLVLHGCPFARIIPKEKLDVFQYVDMDNMRNRAFVFSDGKAVGWIMQPMSGFARFVPFSGKRTLVGLADVDVLTDYCLLVAWWWRWELLIAYILLLIILFGFKKPARAIEQTV